MRGNHQFGVGANLQYFKGDYTSTSRTNGNWIFNGSATGLGLADLLVGRVTSVEHGGPNRVLVNNWHMGLYAQDSWRASSRVTLNVRRAVGAVLRPERREQRDRDLQDGEFPAGDQEQGVPQRAGRPDLSGRRGVPAGTDGVGRPVVEPRAAPRAWRGTSTAMAVSPCVRRTPWGTTSCPASTTTSTRRPRRSATARRWSIRRA